MKRLALGFFVVAATACHRGMADTSSGWTEPTTKMRFVAVPAGSFTMGSPADETGREPQEVQHRVTLSHAFWMGAYEVTQAQWQAVMGSNPSTFSAGGANRPVEQVTWYAVQEFLQQLEKKSPGNRFRLPTEAEWEYACRAGTTTAFNLGTTLNRSHANFNESASAPPADRGQTMKVGSFAPNAWGLYDIHGNVWEWTDDDVCPYGSDPVTDPHGACGASLKIIRGGSWYFGADSARCALRYTHRPQDRGFSLGFRVVRESS